MALVQRAPSQSEHVCSLMPSQAGECMTIKQKIMESSKDPPYPNGHKRSTSRISYLINPSPRRTSSSSEDSARSPSPDGDVPYVDQPFRDGRRRKICHACNEPFGEREPVDICGGCCFERPAGCRDCNWTGWGRCAACRGRPADDDDGPHATTIEGARPFATGFTRALLVGRGGEQQHGPRTGSWGLKQMLGSTAS